MTYSDGIQALRLKILFTQADLADMLGQAFLPLPGDASRKRHEQRWIDDLYAMLSMVASDLTEEINELLDEADRHDAEMLWKRPNG